MGLALCREYGHKMSAEAFERCLLLGGLAGSMLRTIVLIVIIALVLWVLIRLAATL